MKEQNNTPGHLAQLWKTNEITTEQFFFRSEARKLGIKTFADTYEEFIREYFKGMNRAPSKAEMREAKRAYKESKKV